MASPGRACKELWIAEYWVILKQSRDTAQKKVESIPALSSQVNNVNAQALTDALHKSRLLNVEEKPFKRISKRLLNPESLIVSQSSLPLTPPPEETDADSDATATEAGKQKKLEEWRHFREDVSLDFAAFEASIARVQFLLTSNEQERQRYATERVQILSTMQSVRESTADLRSQLVEAQRLLSLRKTYDELTEKITSNRLLKPREDQSANLQKLRLEIADLEKESKDYAMTWAERREQFGRIVDEGMQLRRLIRDEKEEVERREGMQEGADGDEGDATSKGKASSGNTPGPEGDAMTPSQHAQDETGRSSALQVEKSGVAGAASPLRQVTAAQMDGAVSSREDTNMIDEGEVSAISDGELSELEEGEELPDDFNGKMDTT
ncbi:Tho complex subunit 7/Mft1p [Penicillium griseofulvum]|uniref:Tho complex subunit 7/Mft1p n=1 Tax=Penicillium patulum TaxID=5078 RepID=A0A135M0G2_PENPA|nr:Tho complex subunit 7/Mft1p [Penicillium griseofulvum]KXG54661.1 Tho complex subunit 7/Mft1p [Penicillium griseofulvum]